jgi:hypothetical protein
LPRMKMQNKSVEVNGRGGVCRSFHLVRELREVAERRCPPVPHLLRSQEIRRTDRHRAKPTRKERLPHGLRCRASRSLSCIAQWSWCGGS